MTTIIPSDYYATSSSTIYDITDNITGKNNTYSVISNYHIPPKPNINPVIYLYGICLVLIPTATILGNLLVIVSVLRFKALHSAINFLILGLAVADLFVALFVMPYAVYVYVQGGYWFLGPLMCDIYSAFDVACSTASILLLAVISFDRYRAVSKPIQYSRQSQNIKRVVIILIVIWVISLTLASPIVLGVNKRPPDASPYECRFYNPEFSIASSMVSFVIPCFIVLFVYIRIMMALRKREKAAKLRRQANQIESKKEDEEAGQIVAGPAVNVMMLALPSMTRQIRRYERHKAAVENAGEDDDIDDEDGFSGDEEDEYDDDSDDEKKDGEVFESENDLLEGNTDESAVDSGIGTTKRKKIFLNGKRKHYRRRRQRSSGADSLAACAVATKNATKGKTSATPQALCLSSFLPILGTATASIRESRKESIPRKLFLEGILKSNDETSPLNVCKCNNIDNKNANNISTLTSIHPFDTVTKSSIRDTKDKILAARTQFFRSISGPSILDSNSPLMLRRFVLDNDTKIPELLDIQKLEQKKLSCDILLCKNDKNENDLAGSSTPRSSTDSLSENVHVVTNDFVSEGPTSISRKSSDFDSSFANNTVSSLNSSNVINKNERSSTSELKRKLKNSLYFHRRSLTMPTVEAVCVNKRSLPTTSKETFLPAFFRTISKRSPKIFRASTNTVNINNVKKNNCPKLMSIKSISQDDDFIIKNNSTNTPTKNYKENESNNEDENDQLIQSSADTETLSVTATHITVRSTDTVSPTSLNQAIIRRTPLSDQKRKSSLPDCNLATTTASGKIGDIVIGNDNALMETPTKHVPSYIENKRLQKVQNRDDCGSPSVSFNIAGKTFFGGRGPSTSSAPLGARRRSSFIETISDSTKPSSSYGIPSSISSNVISSESTGLINKKLFLSKNKPKHSNSKHSMDSNPSITSSTKTLDQKRKLLNSSKLNGSSTALAVRLVKKTINRKESSLKRKVTKAQRKERRATKTLGIVVGIFLICWVPFFTINILNAVCVLLDQSICQVGFGPFFYSTWIGYMNSFMNPVIYTIFNTEFRKAFKSLILGRNAARRHRARNV